MNLNSTSNNRRFIVLDVVFYAGSLNYDQGTSNYQELKKITKWNGKSYTLVSRYALRYSILETMKNLRFSDSSNLFVPGSDLEKVKVKSEESTGEAGRREEERKGVIQPSEELLFNGGVLKHAELDLFGYLITTTEPQNFREAPVKISHAISMTPYNYDYHFCANIGLAKRIVEAGKEGKMEPNPFVVEVHQTYYIYTIVIDEARIGSCEVYLSKDVYQEVKIEERREENRNYYYVVIKRKKERGEAEIKEYKVDESISVDVEALSKAWILRFTLRDNNKKKERIENLIKAVLNLNRSIKGRSESLQPKLLVLGIYTNMPYKSYKDGIILSTNYEEIHEETIEKKDEQSVKVIRKVLKLEQPVFKIEGLPENTEISLLNEMDVLNKIYPSQNSVQNSNNVDREEKAYVFYSPEIKVSVTSTKNPQHQNLQQKT